MTVNQMEELLNTVAPAEAPRLYQAAREDQMSLQEVMHAAVSYYVETRQQEIISNRPYRDE
jgi:hypothetical protein